MPYKDPEKQKAAVKAWRKRNKEKLKYHRNAQKVAENAYPVRQKCFVKGCELIGERHHSDYTRPREIIWVCRFHHRELFHKKHPNELKKCKVCKEVAVSFGLCNKHYRIFKKIFDQVFAERVRKNRRDYYLKH